MAENKFTFLITAFPDYAIHTSNDGICATISNPHYAEDINVYFYEEDDFTPFCARFSFQHCHLPDEDDVIDWINEIIAGNKFAIEFFKNDQRCFGGDIDAAELKDLSYEKLEQYTGYYGFTKLLDIADSFKVRGWERKNNFDASFVRKTDGTIVVEKYIAV